MRIGWVGGLDRNETHYLKLARDAGHELEFHPGHVEGRGADRLRTLVERSDYVVIVTDVNSHGAVQLARRTAAAEHKPVHLARRCGPGAFRQLLDQLARSGPTEPAGRHAA